jgi:hypothetical protein
MSLMDMLNTFSGLSEETMGVKGDFIHPEIRKAR